MKLFAQTAKNKQVIEELGEVDNNNFLSLSLDKIQEIKNFDDCEIVEIEHTVKQGNYRVAAIYARDNSGGKWKITGTIHYAFVRGLRSKFNPVDEFPAEKTARIAASDATKSAEVAAQAATESPTDKAARTAQKAADLAKRQAEYTEFLAKRQAEQDAYAANVAEHKKVWR